MQPHQLMRRVFTAMTTPPSFAKSFAATGHFLIRDEHHGAYGVIYPVLTAPAYRLFVRSVNDSSTSARAARNFASASA